MTPVQNQQIVGQSLARLTSAYITKPNVRAMLAVYTQPFQDRENAMFEAMGYRVLATTPVNSNTVSIPGTDNSAFDVLGSIVGVQRGGLGDLSYKTIIYLQVAVNRATGRTSDWAGFFEILEPYTSGTVIYLDGDAAFYFGIWDVTLDPNQVWGTLNEAVPNGIGGVFAYSIWPDGNDFEFDSIADVGGTGQGTWASITTSTVGGLWVAGMGWGPGLSPLFASEVS